MRTLAYCRINTDVEGNNYVSVRNLTKSFGQYCTSFGHNLQGVFVDSHNSSERPKYGEMLQNIRESGLAYLIVLRDMEDLGDEMEEQIGKLLELDAMHCQVICDDAEAPNPLQAIVKAWESRSSSSSRGKSIREGMQAKAARGLGLGKTPFGYRIGAQGTFDPVPSEVEIVRLIFRLYLDDDLGVRSIARYLNEHDFRTRRGEMWSMVTIRDLLRNHAYIGTYQRFGLRIPSSHTALVTADEFKRVQDKMRSRSPAKRNQKAEPFLLSGLLYCGECGQHMMGVTRYQTWHRKDGEKVRGAYRYYQCQSRTNRGQCQYHTRRAIQLEAQVAQKLRSMLISGHREVSIGAGTYEEQRQQEQAKLRALKRRYVGQVRRVARSAATLQQLRSVTAELTAERQTLNDRLALYDGDGTQFIELQRIQRDRLNNWDSLGVIERQEALRILISRIVVGDDDIDLVLLAT